MYLSPRHLLVFVVPILVVAAIFGFVAGKRHARAAPREQGLLAHHANIVVEYPSKWQPAVGAPPLPGISIASPLLLTPGGDAARAGLLIGQLPAGEAGPLPARFVALMSQLPRTEVVNFVAVQAYRYSPLRVPGYGGTLEPYVVPSATGPPTALVCYAAQGSDTYIRECEQIVATLTVFGYSGYDLTPKPGYASRLGPLIGALDSERTTLRREMGQRRTAAATAGLAASLADRFATAAASLRTIQAPVAARAAQAALVDAIERAGRSYRALESAVAGEGSGGLAVAQPRVAEAELGVDRALETFALLGYKHP